MGPYRRETAINLPFASNEVLFNLACSHAADIDDTSETPGPSTDWRASPAGSWNVPL